MVDLSSFPTSFLNSENKKKFLIQDPFGLREVIQPVVSISQIEDKITGLGTCFQISPWTWLTAHHVVLENNGDAFPLNEVGAVGFSPGLVLGAMGFSTHDYFGQILEIIVAKKKADDDVGFLPGPSAKPIIIDLAILRVDKSRLIKPPLISPLPISKMSPKVGDEVIGIGFPILGSKVNGSSAPMTFSEQMFGAAGVVTELHPNGVSTTSPWPTFQIEGNWESGMSGGPVIDKQGHIVGVISRSLAPTANEPGVGFAVDLASIPVGIYAPQIDPHNPGWIRGWGVFSDNKLTGFFETESAAELMLASTGGNRVAFISHCPKTDSWIEL